MADREVSKRINLFAVVLVLENSQGAPAGSEGTILGDFGDGYEVEVVDPDGSTVWLGGLPDQAVRPA